jgi:hypothetical protein
MNAAEITLVISTTLGLVACAGAWRACKRELRAENACEELRASLMRGSAVATWTWPSAEARPPAADSYYLHIRADGQDLLPTQEAWDEMRDRAKRILKK